MKTIEQLKAQTPVFLNDWKSKFGVVCDFEQIYLSEEEFNAKVSPRPNTESWEKAKSKAVTALKSYESVNILFASYTYEDYSGRAFVLFEENEKLYEVNGYHCSCYGLEDQWEPEEVVLPELVNRITNGRIGQNEFQKELAEFLGITTHD